MFDLLIVDDENANLESLRRIFERETCRVHTANGARQALEICRQQPIHVVLTDLMMPTMSGMELVRALQTVAPNTEVVVMTAFGTVEKAVEAMRAGAYDFVEKPLKRMQIVKAVKKAAERFELAEENRHLKKELSQLRDTSIIGSSSALRRALEVADQAAPTEATVLILGESGTGKEVLARYIHQKSERKTFVGVNVAALPESLIEA
ncbi:MAG: response regulator, partial [Polyangiales bacterium]